MKHTTTYRQKDNGWQIIISYKDGDRWRQKSRQGFARKSDAKEAEAQLLAQIKKAPRPVEKAMAGITLREFCIEYLKTRKDLVYITKKQIAVWLSYAESDGNRINTDFGTFDV